MNASVYILKFDKMLKSKRLITTILLLYLYQVRIQDFEREGLIVCEYSGYTLIANEL